MEISDKWLQWSSSKCELLAVRNKSYLKERISYLEERREEMLLVNFKLLLSSPPLWIRKCTPYMNSCTVGFPPVLPSFEILWEHQALPVERNEVVCPTFHCEESLGRSQGSLSHAGGSCCFPAARRCHWVGPGALLGWCACCSPWRSWRAPSDFRRGCFRCGHYSSWRAATRRGEEGRGAWEGASVANADEQKFSQGKGRALLLLGMRSVTFGLVTGAAEFCELYESTCIKTILHMWIKGEGRRTLQSPGLSLTYQFAYAKIHCNSIGMPWSQ